MIEVEQKFQASNLEALKQHLQSDDIEIVHSSDSQNQSDEYFNHRQLRFELQDIALRIRTVNDRHVLTFKGPNQDASTKIRTETEIELSEEDAGRMIEIFLGLGMHSVAKLSKTREAIEVTWQGRNVEVCFDSVDEVGDFVELEIVVETEDEIASAKQVLDSLAQRLELKEPTTTSYLEMLLIKQGTLR
jgi:adenylate cyclase class 2